MPVSSLRMDIQAKLSTYRRLESAELYHVRKHILPELDEDDGYKILHRCKLPGYELGNYLQTFGTYLEK